MIYTVCVVVAYCQSALLETIKLQELLKVRLTTELSLVAAARYTKRCFMVEVCRRTCSSMPWSCRSWRDTSAELENAEKVFIKDVCSLSMFSSSSGNKAHIILNQKNWGRRSLVLAT